MANRQPPDGDHAQSDEKLARDQRRDKALREMPEPIEMISVPTEKRFDPVEERDARISVMTADAKQHDVQRDQRVDQSVVKRKRLVGGDEKIAAPRIPGAISSHQVRRS